MPRQHHSAERWAERQRRESPAARKAFMRRWERGEGAAIRTLKLMHAVACRVSPERVDEPRVIEDDRRNPTGLAIRLSGDRVAVWSPRTGIYVLRPPLPWRVKMAVWPQHIFFAELADITRRAFIPNVAVQLYKTHPFLTAMLAQAKRSKTDSLWIGEAG